MRVRRIVGWALAIVVVLVIAVSVGGYFYLQSASFQRLAIRTIAEDVNESTGARTEIGGLDFQLSTLTAHLYNVTIRGNETAGQPPLLQVDKLTVGLKIQSILRRKISLTELLIEHPVAHVQINRDGKSNIPQSSSAQKSGNTSVFDLAAGHVLLSDGAVTYNDKTIPVAADLYDLRTEIHFIPLETRYRGSLSYDNGKLRYANDPVVPHSLNVAFDATPSRFTLDSLSLKLGYSTLSAQVQLDNYSNPIVAGHYDLRIHAQDLAVFVKPASAGGDIVLAGTIHYQGNAQRTLLQNVSLDGKLSGDELTAASSEGRVYLHRLQGQYQLANGTLQARDVAFETLGGAISADVDLQHLDATATGRMRAKLKGISMQAAQQTLRAANIKQVSLTGRLDGAVEALWVGSAENIHGSADVDITSALNRAPQSNAQTIPVNGAIHATYDGQKNILTLRNTMLRIPSAAISAQGEVSDHSNLQVQAKASDLHELGSLINAISGGKSASIQIAGSASLKGAMQGSMHRPQLSGRFDGENLQAQGSQWKSAKFNFQANPSQVSLRDAVLESAHQGRASLNATVALRDWSYLPSNPLTVNLSVQRMSLAELQRLADVHYPLSGDLSAEISVHGTQLNPSGSGSAKIEHAVAYDEPVQQLAATFRADKNSLSSSLSVSLPAGSASGTVSYTPQTKAYTVSLNAPAVVLQKLRTVQAKNIGISGTLAISANGQGTLDNPQLSATLEVPHLQLRDKSVSELKAQVQVANQKAELAIDSQIAETSIHSHANISLRDDYYAEASVDTNGISLEPVLAMFESQVPQGFQGTTEMHATLKGPLKDKSRMEAHLTIPTLKASYQSLEIAAAAPIHADYANSVLTLQPAEIRGTDTTLRVQGSFPIAGTATPTLAAQGSIDIKILRIFDPDLQSSGSFALDVRASGSAANPAVQGQVHLQNVALSTPTAPLGVEKLNGTFDIGNNSVQLSSLNGIVGGGQVSIGGSISYRPNLQFNVSLQSKSVRLRYPDGVRALLDGNLVLSGTKDASTLNGRVLIDSLSFTPDFDLAKFSDQFSGGSVLAEPGLADNVKLAIGVQSKSNLSAVSSQVSIEGQLNLQVVGTAANPVIIGRTDLTSGELFYRNVRYQLQRGIITFDNPNETEPVVNVSATATVEQYNLTLNVRGPFDKLTTAYTSDPPLATADIINLIANGQTTEETSAAGTSTDSILASQVAGQVTGGIQHLAGISSLQVDPLLGGNNQNPSARVAIQQRVTKNFLFTFSTDLSQPGTEIVQGDYQINQRWSVSVTRDEVGGISVDGKYHTKF
jgi:translocation and assembly module TamB